MTGWDLLKALRRYALSIIALSLIGAIAALGYTIMKPINNSVEYLAHASTRITLDDSQVTSKDNTTPGLTQTLLDAQRNEEVAYYTSDSVLNQAVKETGVDIDIQELSADVVVLTPARSFITVIYVKQENEEDALALADAIAQAGTEAIKQAREDNSPYTTTVFQTARVDTVSSGFSMKTFAENEGKNVQVIAASTSPKKKILAGFALGMVLGIAQALLRWFLDKKVYNFDDLSDATNSPVIGATSQEATSATLQSHPTVKFLRSSLLAENQDDRKPVVVTSPRLTDDVLSISQALAESLRSSGQKTLLIDTQNTSNINIQSVTTDNWQAQADDAKYMWGTEADATTTADFLASRSCAQLLNTIIEADIIPIVNAPGILANTAALMPMSNTRTVLVTPSGKTTSTDIRDCEKVLDSVDKQVDDVIMSAVPQSLAWKLRYGYETAQAAA